MSTVRRGAAALVLASLVLAGCGGGSSGTPAAAPVVVAPTAGLSPSLPADAAAASSASAENSVDSETTASAAVREFIEVVNDAYLTGTTAALGRMSSRTCVACSGYMSSIRSYYAHGGHVLEARVTPISVIAAGSDKEHRRSVVVVGDYEGLTTASATGVITHVEPPQRGQVDIYDVKFAEGRWTILGVRQGSSP